METLKLCSSLPEACSAPKIFANILPGVVFDLLSFPEKKNIFLNAVKKANQIFFTVHEKLFEMTT